MPCDILVVADLGGERDLTGLIARIRQARGAGHSVAVFDWRRYADDVTAPSSTELRRLAQDHVVQIIAPAESVRARIAIVADSVVLEHEVDLFPKITVPEFLIVNSAARPDLRHSETVAATVGALLGNRTVWMSEDQAWARAQVREPTTLAR